MLKLLKKMTLRYNGYMNHVSRVKAHEVLLRSSDRMLEDAGFSRELLEQGVAAWPWRQVDSEQSLKPLALEELATLQANARPELFSENESHGLNVTCKESVKTSLHDDSRIPGAEDTQRKVA